MENLPDCPVKHNCEFGKHYPDSIQCAERRRRITDGLYECRGFKVHQLTTLDKLPDPTEELFPGHDYGRRLEK